MVVLDTNVIIDHLRQSNTTIDTHLMEVAKKISKESLAISVISIQELYEGKSTRNKSKEMYLLTTISALKILPYTYEIAISAGEIARALNRSTDLSYAAIAATCIINSAELFTLNAKHFKNINNLELAILKEKN